MSKNSEGKNTWRHLTHCYDHLDTFSRKRDCVESESIDSTSNQMGYPEDTTTADNSTQLDLSDFLDSLWPADNIAPPQPQNPSPTTCTVSTITMQTRTYISISKQMDICNLLPKRSISQRCNTTPTFKRDRNNQFAPNMTSRGVSPQDWLTCQYDRKNTNRPWQSSSIW